MNSVPTVSSARLPPYSPGIISRRRCNSVHFSPASCLSPSRELYPAGLMQSVPYLGVVQVLEIAA